MSPTPTQTAAPTPSEAGAPDLEFLYFTDPMCSWCWGFSPVLQGLRDAFDVPIRVVLGGLRHGDAAEAVDDRLQEFLAHHWHQVAEASGQPFDHEILSRRGWRYNTEPACRAVVTMRDLHRGTELPYLARVQRAFYAEGLDVTDPTVLSALSAGFVDSPTAFAQALASDDMKARTQQDFAFSQRLGVRGFPSLVIRDGEELAVLTRGFAPLDVLKPGLERWLRERHGAAAEGLFCDLDGDCGPVN